MDDTNPELAAYVEGESALVAGDPAAVAELFRKLDVPGEATSKLGPAVTEMLASAAGLAAAVGSPQGAVSGNSFHMTAESYSRYLDLAGSTKEKLGIVSGVLRQSDGTIDTVVDLVKSSPVSPAAMANVPALAAAVAVRVVIRNLEVLLESVDAKLDVVIRDNRNEALGNIQGTTHILDKAFGYFEETGALNATLWDQVAGQAAGLAQMHSVAVNQIDSIAAGLEAKNFGRRLKSAKAAAAGDLQHWLIITAVALANMVRMDSLESVHAGASAGAEVHSRYVERAKERRLELTRSKLQRLADAVSRASDFGPITRIANPLEMPRLYDAVEELQRLLEVFAASFGMPDTSAVRREQWHESVLSLGKRGGAVVAGAVGAAAGSVASVPKAIAGGVENGILRVAHNIEERRKSKDEV